MNVVRGVVLALLMSAAACTSGEQAAVRVEASTTPTTTTPTTAVPATAPTTAAPTTATTANESGCGPFGEAHVVDQTWPAGTELQLLIDTSVNDDDDNVLRHARQVIVRSNGVVDGRWSLTYIDPVGERLANYAPRVSVQNPVDESFGVEADYVVDPISQVSFASADQAAGIDAAYADFVAEVFGPTDGGLGQDERFAFAVTDLFAGGGFELLDTASASNRILGLLTSVHGAFGQRFVVGESSIAEGPWADVGLPLPLEVGEIQVESSIARSGCLLIESTAAVGEIEFERRVQLDARGLPVSVTSFVRFGSDRANLRVTTTIGVMSTKAG